MTVTISGTDVDPGEREWVTHRIGRDADRRPIELQLCVVNGAADGPTMWAQGCVHGNEPVGGLAVRDFVNRLDPAEVRGTVVGLPVANPPGFNDKRRECTVRHVGNGDVNGVFPGDPDGPFPARLADAVYSLAERHADFVLDFHSADEQTVMHTSFAYVPATGDETGDRSRGLARAAGVEHRVELPRDRIEGYLIAELARAGIPAVMVESGSGARVYDFARDRFAAALDGVARERAVLPRDGWTDPGRDDQVAHDDLLFLFADAGGYVEAFVRGGDRVTDGEPVVEITDIRGEVVETVRSPVEADVLAVRSFPTARPGDMTIELAPVPESE